MRLAQYGDVYLYNAQHHYALSIAHEEPDEAVLKQRVVVDPRVCEHWGEERPCQHPRHDRRSKERRTEQLCGCKRTTEWAKEA